MRNWLINRDFFNYLATVTDSHNKFTQEYHLAEFVYDDTPLFDKNTNPVYIVHMDKWKISLLEFLELVYFRGFQSK